MLEKIPHGHEIVQAPEKGLIFETYGFPLLILPVQFESWKDYLSRGEKTMWLQEGKAVYTSEAVELHGSIKFYYIRAKVDRLDN